MEICVGHERSEPWQPWKILFPDYEMESVFQSERLEVTVSSVSSNYGLLGFFLMQYSVSLGSNKTVKCPPAMRYLVSSAGFTSYGQIAVFLEMSQSDC